MRSKQNKKPNFFENAILIFLFAGILFSAGFYIFQANNLASSGLRLSELDKKTAVLEKEIGDLKMKSTDLQSIGILEKESAQMGMVQIFLTEFLNTKGEVAIRR